MTFPLRQLFPACVLTLLFTIAGNSRAAELPQALSLSSASQAAPRIVEHIDENRLVTLKGNLRPEARAENDRGRVSPDLQMGDLNLVLRRSLEQQAAFEAFLASQQDHSSPNFHHWLTPDQIGQQFGPAQADLDTITQWLQNHNLAVTYISKDHLSIRFGGTASQVESTFHTEIHNLQVKVRSPNQANPDQIENHIANMTNPKIPDALSPVVVGVAALHNFFPRPLHKIGSQIRLNSSTGKWERIPQPASTIPVKQPIPSGKPVKTITLPQFGTGGGTPADIEDISPYDFATIYNVLPLWNASTPIDGTGQTIAIAGTSNINPADITTFRSAFGLPAKAAKVIITNSDPGDCPSGANSCINDLYENTLDVEWSGAIAKNAQIILVTSAAVTTTTDNLLLSEQYIVDHVTAPIMNVSYGECELGIGSENTLYNTLWSTAQGSGIAVFVASGDQGSASCDAGQDTSTPYGAQYGLSVSGLASTPYDTAVGGTDLNWDADQAKYWATSNNATNKSSALGYIPETTWNDTCSNSVFVANVNNQLNMNLTAAEVCDDIGNGQITSSGGSLLGLIDIVGGSGGKSSCIDGDGSTLASCTKGYPKPSWQTGVTGIPADGVRDIPDVSFFASNGFYGSAYVVCVSVAGTCSYTATTEPSGEEVGGTSVASPIMAAVMALINQKAAYPQGNPNVELYKLAAKESYSGCSTEAVPLTGSACVFNDVDTDTIAMPCDVGSLDCNGTDIYGVLSGYDSTVGFDLGTGLGSMNVANLVNAYPVAAPITISFTPTSLTFGSTVVGTSAATQAITVNNSTASAVTINGITITGANPASFTETNTCGSSIAVSTSCVITVTFAPKVSGTLSASVSVADSLADSPQAIPLNGVAKEPVSAAAVTLSATQLTFPTTQVGATAPTQSVMLTNSGTASLTITGLTITGADPADYTESNTCGSTVAAGAKCTITVTFAPTAAGNLLAQINIADNASNSPQVIVLVGVATSAPAPAVTFTPTALAFGNELTGVSSAPQVITLKNTGNASLKVTAVSITGVSAIAFSLPANTDTCITTLAAGASCTISVAFDPLAAGSDIASISVTDNATGSPQTVGLSGTGVAPAPTVTLTPTSLTFPSTTVGTASATQTVTLKNTGTATLTVTSTTVTNGQTGQNFLATGSCGTVAVGASCTTVVTFQPTTVGTLTATLSFADNASGSPQTVTLTGTGTEPSGATYTLTGAAVTIAPGASGTSAITGTGTMGYVGPSTVTLSNCTLTTSPSGAVDAPTCSITASTVTFAAGSSTGSGGTVTISTTGPSSSFRRAQAVNQSSTNRTKRLVGFGGLTVAGLLLFGIPARKRNWKSLLTVLIFMAGFGVLSGCGGSNNGGGGGKSNPGTTAGSYTFTVTGTDSTGSPTQTATITVTVS